MSNLTEENLGKYTTDLERNELRSRLFSTNGNVGRCQKLEGNKEIKTEMMMEQIKFFLEITSTSTIFSNFDFSRDLYVKCNLRYLGMDSVINL